MTILGGLKWLADKLLSVAGSIGKASREDRDRVATYCDDIANCLSSAYLDLREGQIPHGRCHEMEQYLRDLREVLVRVLAPAELESLQQALMIAHRVEHIDDELKPGTRPGSAYAELDMAAGKFRAVANKIRATRPGATHNK